MAENVAGMRVEGAKIVDTGAQRRQGHGQHVGAYALLATILAAILIGGTALHERQASHPTARAIPRVTTSAETRFLESNTIDLPNAVTAEVRPVVTSSQQQYLDVNTAWLPTAVAEAAPATMTSSERRFLEVNTVMLQAGPSAPYAEDVTPLPGQRR
jgi:hypothetical protein